jgi:membrane protein
MDLIKDTVKDFIADDCPRKAAALAFYAIFALPAMLLLIITIAGFVWSEEAARGELVTRLSDTVGPEAAQQVHAMVENVNRPDSNSAWAVVAGIAGLLFSATGALVQIQRTLNDAWNVEPEKGGLRHFLLKRLVSFLYILGLGLLLIAAIVASGMLSAFQEEIREWINIPGIQYIFFALNIVLFVGILTVMFAAVFKFFPDVHVEWRDVWVGAAITAVLFVIGNVLIGFYLGYGDKTGAYGAAGSLALLLLWIYFAAMIFLLGAEFTQNWWQRHGEPHGSRDSAEAGRSVRDDERRMKSA